ncbi:MAG: hypothetical protein RJA02_1711 [Armatimonadota bacterium]
MFFRAIQLDCHEDVAEDIYTGPQAGDDPVDGQQQRKRDGDGFWGETGGTKNQRQDYKTGFWDTCDACGGKAMPAAAKQDARTTVI